MTATKMTIEAVTNFDAKTVTFVIDGPRRSGKSLTGEVLRRALIEHGAKVHVEDGPLIRNAVQRAKSKIDLEGYRIKIEVRN